MSDKILTEAFDKLKAIEEADELDPFGEEPRLDDDGYAIDDEEDFDKDMKSGYPGDNDKANVNTETLAKDLNFIKQVKGTVQQESPEFYIALSNVIAYTEAKLADETGKR